MKAEEIQNKTNEALSYLVRALESGESDVLTHYLAAMARFHRYSFGNIMLIARQKPNATHIAGMRTWNSLGRFVRRGEKGILILAPMVTRRRKPAGDERILDSTTVDTQESDGKQPRPCGFRAAYVFDITQTEGQALASLTEVTGDPSGHRERLIEFVKGQGVELDYSDTVAPAKGLSHGGRITLLSGMQPADEFSTLVHEVAHELLHRGARRAVTTKQVRETEAEAIAFVVSKAVGLDTGTSAQDYIQLWNGDAQLLRESLELVQHTAAMILSGIAPPEAT
jgi:hypothetical protein